MSFSFLNLSSILKKFLIFNLIVFLVLGIFTYLYLSAIKPSLVESRSTQHSIIINNTSNHIDRLNVEFTKESITEFLLSTRFLFQNLDRVQLYSLGFDLLADTDTLDLAEDISIVSQDIEETPIDKSAENASIVEDSKSSQKEKFNIKTYLEQYSKQNNNEKLVIAESINNNFFVITINSVEINQDIKGYIAVSEIANDILVAVDERKNFILRTVISIAIVILIFSVFLNKYILKPIRSLVLYTKAIREKDVKMDKHEKYFLRKDEVGQLSRSLNEMTENLQQRINVAETFSTDLAHEIRNPLASLKGASEILNTTTDPEKRKKLIGIIAHDIERIERLITDYSQMLKDEASLSRSKMEKINLSNVVKNVCDDFNSDISNLGKKINIEIVKESKNKSLEVFGVETRLEQILANLLDNAVSFSADNKEVLVKVSKSQNNKVIVNILDEGEGFKEKDTTKIFKRFYSNRPDKFGQHSGLGLNIVKNLVDLHNATITASNRGDHKGASIEIIFPKV